MTNLNWLYYYLNTPPHSTTVKPLRTGVWMLNPWTLIGLSRGVKSISMRMMVSGFGVTVSGARSSTMLLVMKDTK